ncbi:MAG: glycosyltransferase family 4 protein [Spirulina sp. SIO3F2]|nr:glycosyltransferase family 4 protein [Spirulina sp. SIO3F2]
MPETRVALLVPSIELGAYWQPVLAHFTETYPQAVFYTGKVYPNFDPALPGCAIVQVVGKFSFKETQAVGAGYGRGIIVVSPKIIPYLIKFRPQVVYPQAFSLWTVFTLLLKPFLGWKVVIIHDGSSPNTDLPKNNWRTMVRRLMIKLVDGFVANSEVGRQYLIKVLGVPAETILKRIYLVPDAAALQKQLANAQPPQLDGLQRPVFLYVGRITQRKGLKPLLKACSLLREQGHTNYTLLIIGVGDQEAELRALAQQYGIEAQLQWEGWVDYGRLGAYFQQADVFVFPTYEDVWGMVVPEAMVFGKPILCSNGAAACELVQTDENGFVFDPHDPGAIAQGMQYFLEHPERIEPMGERSRQIIANYTPATAAAAFMEMTTLIMGQN